MLSESQIIQIRDLVNDFKDSNGHKKSEEHIQSLFTLNLLAILGWNKSQFKINQGQDVSTGKIPDILLKNNSETLVVIESKDASNVNMLNDYYQKNGKKTTFVQQLRNCCEAEGVYWGVLTNFIEWRVYSIIQNRLYLDKKYAFHALLWKEADKKDYVDLFSEAGYEFLDNLQMTNIVETDGRWSSDPVYYPIQEEIRDHFFESLKDWRKILNQNIQENNSKLELASIEAFSQKIIDRIIFIDYCADNKIILQNRLSASLKAKSNIFYELKKIFFDMDERFNSELFAEDEVDRIQITDDILRPIISGLADIDFSKLSVHVIGEVYERYLGETQKRNHGIYYTPEYIVNYIVENTVGKLLKNCKSIEELENIRVIDPACGSGSFLIRVFDEFLKNYKRFQDAPLFEFELRKKILLKNIYGVDLDERAVEITKLNLLVKALEGAAHLDISGKKILPNIKLNIRCGNSIVSGAVTTKGIDLFWQIFQKELKQLEELHSRFGSETNEDKQSDIFHEILVLESSLDRELDKTLPKFSKPDEIRSFNYEVAFPQAFKDGGFDCVLGNPPYIDSELMSHQQPEVRSFAQNYMSYTKGNWDIYIAFFERAFLITKTDGFIGYITPDKWISKRFGEEFRKNTASYLVSLTRAGREVFKNAKIDSVISIYKKSVQTDISTLEARSDDIYEKFVIKKTSVKPIYEYDYLFSSNIEILNKIWKMQSASSPDFLCENACATSDCYTLKEFIESSPNSEIDNTRYYKIVNTGTIGRYSSKWEVKEMTYIKDKYINPVVQRAYFDKVFTNSYGTKAKKQKLIIKSLTLLEAMIDYHGEYIPGKSTLILTTDNTLLLEYFSALFNSKIAFFYIAEKYSSSSYNGGITFTKEMINGFPIINPDLELQNRVSNLVKLIHAEHSLLNGLSESLKRKKEIQIESIQREINNIFYGIYGLSDEEVKIVDSYTNKTRKTV